MNISVSRNGVELGEWPEEEIQTLLDEGTLLPTDYYWMQGMTDWQQISTSIRPPPPTSRMPRRGQTVHNEPPTSEDVEDKNSSGWSGSDYLWFFICLVFSKGIWAASNGNLGMLFGGLAALAVVYVILRFIAAWLHGKLHIPLWSIPAVILISLTVFVYLQGDSTTQALNEESQKENNTLPRMLDSITREDGTSVSANHTMHAHYTLVTDDPPTPDALRNTMLPTLKADFAAHPELQALRDKGVTFELDYFKQDGTPITQIVIGPNDLK